MADKDETASTEEGTESNEVVNPESEKPTKTEHAQSPSEFFNPDDELAARAVDPPKNHATKGMTTLGHTEASRVQDEVAPPTKEK
jgi:hypothetical protein